MTNIAVIGVGGVGGYFGAKLAVLAEKDPGLAVHFVARGRHLAEIRAQGLVLDAQGGRLVGRPASATDAIAELPVLDHCLIAVKGYDLPGVLGQLEAKIGDSTVVLPLLNGVDIYERVRGALKKGYLHPAGVYISAYVEKPGTVVQRGAASSIFLGPEPGKPEDRSVLPLLGAAGIAYAWKDDPFAEIWGKYVFIAPFGLVTADSGLTMGEVFQSKPHLEQVKVIMAEVVALARAKGVALPATIIEDSLAKAAKFPPETRTSFQRDFSRPGKPDERDLFGGSVLRLGAELGVPVPSAAGVYARIKERKPL